MNIKKIKIVILFLLGFGLLTAQAQQAITATGGDASGSGGTVAYSVGQVVYTTNTGTNGSVAQGVQQSYIISIVLGIEDNSIKLELTAYPNPTTNFLTLNVGNAELSTLRFQLYDISGKLIESRKIVSSTETIGMENLPSAIYFLKVVNNNKEVKTFKIIKK
ncbi:T9SS type A sorting domain-containing protein [Flavobacterium sp. LS1P28]|uniref:T9SS type A sorting domain-containing protein n=1 Tax=Flavobacterium bomense TaxID=2497483 RepID=A0A432CFD6_9FLAO|nr:MULTISPECIES: T9SS type A sorting domain-containing protein [Flavobacterium]RTY73080.1 T9SS type A sorting domain-containing protein [Flavobacterium sp. LS1R10]RTY79187.1 T9SS type A sorting domain-containing protein [Flavobacterium sp. LS1P28]RTZ01578.1 T9SS type A sorting domain-containing protein [Flavobacterium bomense]